MSGTSEEDRLQRIREVAYDLWEKEGYPEGREHELWLRAEAVVDGKPEPSTQERADAEPSISGPSNPGLSDKVDESSEESFPASDPPSFTR